MVMGIVEDGIVTAQPGNSDDRIGKMQSNGFRKCTTFISGGHPRRLTRTDLAPVAEGKCGTSL
jgi:hypothetical protein